MIYKYSRMELAAIKRHVKNIAPYIKRMHKLVAQAEAIQEEYNVLQEQVEEMNKAMHSITKGQDINLILNSENNELEISESPELDHIEEVEGMEANSPAPSLD